MYHDMTIYRYIVASLEVDRSTSYAVPSSSDAVRTSSGVSEPFIFKRLNGQIKVCAGCKGSHVKSTDNGLLFPPFDVCLSHKELLYFTNPKNGQGSQGAPLFY